MRHLTLSIIAATSLFSGCIVYDNECAYEEGYGDHEYDHDNRDDVVEAIYDLTPNTIAPGEVIISSLISDMALDYNTIVEVEFSSSDVRVCTTTARDDELLITIGATDAAMEGYLNMIITFEDGTSERIAEALLVSFGDDETEGPNGGNDAGGSDGGGSNGGGSNGSGDDGGSIEDDDSICG
ncbi:MAG: hypothetical protein P8R54_23985 [Myxococcota bacterium]|nr:hypothetical protein [Myxococcota bacterium]